VRRTIGLTLRAAIKSTTLTYASYVITNHSALVRAMVNGQGKWPREGKLRIDLIKQFTVRDHKSDNNKNSIMHFFYYFQTIPFTYV
jgi:hypothetical protein